MGEIREVIPARGGRIDRFLRTVAPGTWARREASRLRARQIEIAGQILDDWRRGIERDRHHQFRSGGYQGATKKRGYSQWSPGEWSADEDILDDLGELRARSRDLIRNDPHAAGIVDTWVSNIVGSGLRPQSRINAEALGLSEEAADEFRKTAEAIFDRFWARADAAGNLSFGELQGLALRQVFENGDVFLIPRPNVKLEGAPALQLQVIEADQVTTPMKEMANLYVRDGIEVSDRGEHLVVFLKQTHPGDPVGKTKMDDFLRIPVIDPATGVRNVYHLLHVKRPLQTRGVPALAPAMLHFRDLSQYFRAELTAAKVAACFALFITTPDPLGDATRASILGAGQKREESLEVGMIRYLDPGQDIKAANPGRPNSAFDQFATRILRAIGAAIGAPYEVISQDFSQTTYTSGRMALNEVRRTYNLWKNWFVEKLCQPIYSRVLEEAFLAGELKAPQFYERIDLFTAARWVGPGWSWVDPAKEVKATVEAINANLATLADEAAARGYDWEELLEQRAREKEKADELGLTPEPPAPPGGPPGAGEEEDDDETEDGEDEDGGKKPAEKKDGGTDGESE
jgi:lambda family phage portal protein